MANELYVKYHGSWVKLLDLYINGILPPYAPTVWNDTGVYSYFYIDFGEELQPFSVGILNESMIVSGTSILTITDISHVSAGVYKIYCNISTAYYGVVVTNTQNSILKFLSSGNTVGFFSVAFLVAGLVSYIKLQYLYESVVALYLNNTTTEALTTTLWESVILSPLSETETIIGDVEFPCNPSEIYSVTLT